MERISLEIKGVEGSGRELRALEFAPVSRAASVRAGDSFLREDKEEGEWE